MKPSQAIIIADTKRVLSNKSFFAITALATAVIDVSQCDVQVLENASGTIGDVTTNIPIPAGVTIYGKFNSIELDSGSVIAYYQ